MEIPLQVSTEKPKNIRYITGIAIAFLFSLLLPLLIRGMSIGYPDKIFYSRFVYWADVLILIGYSCRIERQPLLIWKEKNSDFGFFIVSIVVLYLLNIACGIVSSIPSFFGWHENNEILKRIALMMKDRPLFLVFTALTAGVTEEVIFRGYMLTRLSLLFKNRYVLPVIISSLLFSVLHHGYKSLREYIFTFLIGVVFCVYYQKYRNIKVLIVVHFLIDMISMELATHFYKLIK
jgi:hypothetical protein